MAQGVYAPINGKEIREVLKRQVCKEIDAIPGLKVGLSFKKVQIDVGFNISCYPEDVPCPEGEFSFVIENEASETGFYETHYKEVEALENKISNLETQKVKLDSLIETAKAALETVMTKHEVIVNTGSAVDNSINAVDNPDKLRIENELPVPSVQSVGLSGAKAEVFSKPVSQVGLRRI